MSRRNDTLRRPRALEPGGAIAVLSPSSPSSPERIEVAADSLRARGFDVRVAANTFSRHRGYLAGSDEERIESLNQALRDESIDAIFFARGGYGATRILDRVDYEAIVRDPKPIVGYSDISAIHQAVAALAGVASFHGPMLNTDFFESLSPEVDRWTWNALGGEAPLRWQFEDGNVFADGSAEGTLFGGCLSLSAALLGTPFDYWVDDGIWFWEDIAEPAYRIDRMLTTLRLSGRLTSLRGVIIGKLRECGVGEQDELQSLFSEFFGSRGIPVLRDMPFGHFGNNLLLPIGRPVAVDTLSRTLTFPEPLVERKNG
ncbi:MAG: LD-carboxypeptidase [Thermoanaerobaculia bacterium]|nr:LD-carboxypeptidase [Thermoanaerobaculia bacterium]